LLRWLFLRIMISLLIAVMVQAAGWSPKSKVLRYLLLK